MPFLLILLRIVINLYDRAFKKNVIIASSQIFLLQISSGVGDALMATPVLRRLKEKFPDAVIDVLCSRATEGVLEGHPAIRRMLLIETGWGAWQLIRKLRASRYETYIGLIPSNTISQILIPYFANIPSRIKHRTPHQGYRNYDFLFQQIVEIPEGQHRIECNLELLKCLGIDFTNDPVAPEILISEDEQNSSERILTQAGFKKDVSMIGFHPGCNPAAAIKRWAPEKYAQLGDRLQKEIGAQIVIVGGKDELDDVRKIQSLMATKPIVVAGACNLKETAAAIRRCHFFISNDSGIMHLATAVGIPTFAIFGPKDERHIGPYGSIHTVIRNGRDVNAVSVEQVIRVLKESPYGFSRFYSANISRR